MIDNEREVPVLFSPGHLVDPDLEQVGETVGIQALVTHPLDDPPDRLPIDPEHPRDRRLVGTGHKPRDEIVEIAGEPRAVPRERNTLDMHPMLRTAQSPQARADIESPHPEIQVPPHRLVMLAVLAMPRRIAALRAAKAPTTQRDDHDDSVGLEADRPNPYSRQAQQTRECG
jgi:hypothetical protein